MWFSVRQSQSIVLLIHIHTPFRTIYLSCLNTSSPTRTYIHDHTLPLPNWVFKFVPKTCYHSFFKLKLAGYSRFRSIYNETLPNFCENSNWVCVSLSYSIVLFDLILSLIDLLDQTFVFGCWTRKSKASVVDLGFSEWFGAFLI